jgi:hypothetical protein
VRGYLFHRRGLASRDYSPSSRSYPALASVRRTTSLTCGPSTCGATGTTGVAFNSASSASPDCPLGEADFYFLEAKDPMIIEVTLSELDDALLDRDTYARFLRGFDASSGQIEDELSGGLEPVLTVRVEVGDNFTSRRTLLGFQVTSVRNLTVAR